MSKYIAQPGTSVYVGFEVLTEPDEHGVSSYVTQSCTEAEANIIAFALNAVADGFTLYAREGEQGMYLSRQYDGPIEGVRP